MRGEREMYQMILDIAKETEQVLAVYMNGSRTNENVPGDIFQDYDIVFVVKETQPFIEDKNWIHRFGNILYMQYPDESPFEFPGESVDKESHYGWLMQFDDGVRVDLTVQSAGYAKEHIHDDKLCRILLDKEGIMPDIPKSTDMDYHVKKPTEAEFAACCNEFWWCSNNLAKGLWREEMPYVQDMTNFVVRKELERMLSWISGIRTGFTVSVGKSAKYLYRWLNREEYQSYLDTYFGGSVQDAWRGIRVMCDLFDKAAGETAEKLGFSYNRKEAEAAREFLFHARELPRDATEVY